MTHTQSSKPTALLFSGDLPEHVCTILRTVAPLQAAGWTVLMGGVSGLSDSPDGLDRIHDVDVVVIQRDWPANASIYRRVMQRAHQHNKPVVYDLDDLLFDLPADHTDYSRYRACRPHVALALAEADLVTCSTASLASAISPFAPNAQVLPNYLPSTLWRPILAQPEPEPTASRPLRIGYCGGHSHGPDIEMIQPVLLNLLSEFAGQIQLCFWGLRPPPQLLEREDVRWEAVEIGAYADFVKYFGTQRCDIFLAPLVNSLFNRCKSGLKFLEYSALSIPGVYSRLEPYQELVLHGENGYLATDLSEWDESLRRLISDSALRRRMGNAAKQSVVEHWLLEDNAAHWHKKYADAVAQAALGKRTNQQISLVMMAGWHDELRDALAFSERNNQQKMIEMAALEEHKRTEMAALEERRRAELGALEERLHQTQVENADLYRLAHEQRQLLYSLQHQLAVVQGSLGWQLLQSVTPLRYRLIPGGSRREQAVQSAFSRLQGLRNEGLRGLLRKQAGQAAQTDGVLRGHHQDTHGHSFSVEIRDDETSASPSVSVVIVTDQSVQHADLASALQQWQNIQSVPTECLVWNSQEKQGWSVAEPHQPWPCENLVSLIEKTKGSYICLASPEIIEERATLVEENLVALYSEHLAITLNIHSNPLLIETMIRQQMIPASVLPPFGPSFVHRSCFDESSSVDLARWLAATKQTGVAVCVGKLLVHTTSVESTGHEPAFIKVARSGLRQMGRYLYSVSSAGAAEALPAHHLSSVDFVLPVEPLVSDKPTVLMIMPVLAVGGAEQVHLYMAEQLQKDVRLVIVALEPHIHGLGTSADQFRRYTPYVYTTDDFLIYPLLYSWFGYLIKRFQPETLYIANGTNWIYDAIQAIKANHPGLRVAGQVYDDKAGWINRYTPAIVQTIDVHIGTNQNICAEYLRRGAKPAQIHLIEHCVDVEAFSPERYSTVEIETLRTRFGVPPGNRVVTFMARLHQQKRPMDFVELARRYAGDTRVTFLMVGDGPLAHTVEQELKRIECHNVIRLPFHRPSSEIFALSDVYVLPSEYEGMPLAILEAQAMGKPVVVTDVGNNREVLEITGGGVIVDRIGDIGGLQKGVQQMLSAPPPGEMIRRSVLEGLSARFGILPWQMAEKYRRALLSSKQV